MVGKLSKSVIAYANVAFPSLAGYGPGLDCSVIVPCTGICLAYGCPCNPNRFEARVYGRLRQLVIYRPLPNQVPGFEGVDRKDGAMLRCFQL